MVFILIFWLLFCLPRWCEAYLTSTNFKSHFKSYFKRKIKSHYEPVKIRRSRSQMFFKIRGLKNFVKFTGKHLCWGFLLIRLQASRPAISLTRDSNARCFPVIIAKFLRTAFFKEHFRWLLLENWKVSPAAPSCFL